LSRGRPAQCSYLLPCATSEPLPSRTLSDQIFAPNGCSHVCLDHARERSDCFASRTAARLKQNSLYNSRLTQTQSSMIDSDIAVLSADGDRCWLQVKATQESASSTALAAFRLYLADAPHLLNARQLASDWVDIAASQFACSMWQVDHHGQSKVALRGSRKLKVLRSTLKDISQLVPGHSGALVYADTYLEVCSLPTPAARTTHVGMKPCQ
jgi:hypothetical protein